jgi:hypothetical protein
VRTLINTAVGARGNSSALFYKIQLGCAGDIVVCSPKRATLSGFEGKHLSRVFDTKTTNTIDERAYIMAASKCVV